MIFYLEALSTNATEEFIKQERYDIGLTTGKFPSKDNMILHQW